MPRYYGLVKEPFALVDTPGCVQVKRGPHVLLGFLPGEGVPVVTAQHKNIADAAKDIVISLSDGTTLQFTGVWTTADHQLRVLEDGHRVFECYVTEEREHHG